MKNKCEIQNNVALITVINKKGVELVTKIDAEDLDRVVSKDEWFAEWSKAYNNYIVQNITTTNVNGHLTSVKQSLQSFILETHSKAPIKNLNGDTLDNRKSNLEILARNRKNQLEEVNEDTVAIILKDKYDKIEGKALISKDDKSLVINDTYSWVFYKHFGKQSVVANTPNGRIFLEDLIIESEEGKVIYHINKNPLDCRRENLELKDK